MSSVAIVIPIYNESSVLPELFVRLERLFASAPELRWSAVFVNDGSRDTSADLIATQAGRDARFKLIDLSRNFGHQAALTAGLAHVGDADAVVTMDADLQDPPELVAELVGAWARGR